MANNEAERESLLWRRVSNWKAKNTGTGSNASPLSDLNSGKPVKQILDQPNMQPNQQTGNALQQWMPPAAPFVDTDAAAALAAARNRLSQSQQQQTPRPEPPLYSGCPDTNAANSAPPNAASAAAAVLARVRQQQQQQGIPNLPTPNPQQHLMPTNPLTDDRWSAMNNRPHLTQQFHLPSMPLHPSGTQPGRPPAMMGPQMPTPFPSQISPTKMRPPFSTSPPAPNRPSILNDQPRLAALMAEYNNRLGQPQRPPMMPTEFGMPRPMIAPRQTLPMTLPTSRPGVPVYPVTTVPNKPMMPSMSPVPVGSLPPSLYSNTRPVLPNFSLPGSMQQPPVPNSYLNLPPKPPIGMGWPDTRMPPVPIHPGLVRSNSAPPIPPQPYFNPVVHFSQMHNMPQLSMPMMTFPLAEGMFFPDQSATIDGGVLESYSRTSPKPESKEECGASGSEGTDDEYKQRQRPMSADSMVRRCNSASHGDVDAEGQTHRRHQSASSQSMCLWNAVSESIRSGQYADKSDQDEAPTEEAPHISYAPIEQAEPPSIEVFPAQDAIEAESNSRAVVISDFNRHGHGALVEDTVEAMSDDESSASFKHRKVAAPRNPRRRVRSTLSNSTLAPSDFGNSSPAASSPPESNSTDPTFRVHFEETEVVNPPSKGQADGDVPRNPRLPFYIPSLFPAYPSATCSVLLSLQYAKIIIVLGFVLPVSELLSPYIMPYSYRAFYVYLYMGSIIFMIYINASAAWRGRVRLTLERRNDDATTNAAGRNRTCKLARSRLPRLRFKKDESEFEDVRYGSVYLRIGLNAFGIGSMVYCGLEIAREIEQWTLVPSPNPYVSPADRPIELLLPACRAVLTILQMHFILFNEKTSEIRRQRTPARFGLAHMIATNVCEWLGVVVQETRHELAQLKITTGAHDPHVQVLTEDLSNSTISAHNSTHSPSQGIVAPLLHTVAPLLSPCTIEYSLICGVLLFEMWKEVGQAEDDNVSAVLESSSFDTANGPNAISDSPITTGLSIVGATGASISSASFSAGGTRTRGAHQLSADLTHSQRGAFGGVLLLVLTILGVALLSAQRSLNLGTDKASWIPFDAVLEAILSSAVILGVFIVAMSTRKLRFNNVPSYPLPMDLFLLVVAQTSAYVYSLFVIIGCFVLLRNPEEPVAVHYHAAFIMAVEALSTFRAYAQTHIIVRAWHRRPQDAKQAKEKPGRQAVTFLVLANVCLWAASTFGSARVQRLPHHRRLFGDLPWTAIANACLPLTIFLHLHSSICLFEVWKNCYKFRPD